MKVIDPGHLYHLNTLDGNSYCWLTFVKRDGLHYPGNVGHHQGTTTQEVLRACIDRAKYVNNQIPCWQTRLSIFLMGFVIWLYEYRAALRHYRQIPGFTEALYGKTCRKCGHVGCTVHPEEKQP